MGGGGAVASPLASSKVDHSSSTSKPSSSHYSPSASHFHASSTPTSTQRTLPKLPTNSAVPDSPSLSVRSSTNTNFSSDLPVTPLVVHADSTSLKSDDSSSVSEGHLHPSSHQQTNSSRQHDSKQQQPRSTAAANSSATNNSHHLSKPLNNAASSSTGTTPTSSMGIPIDRAPSPSPSLISEREREENERIERELELKRKRLQIYVFICRCIACPFNSKQSSDMARKHLKITLVQYGVIKERFVAFLNGKTHIEADEGNHRQQLFLLPRSRLSFSQRLSMRCVRTTKCFSRVNASARWFNQVASVPMISATSFELTSRNACEVCPTSTR